jgi:cobalt-zinc-cadmium efflux system membrane fusion protein
VPESVCTRCNPKLIAGFQERNDWCAEHGLPESQCILCNSEVEAKWAAMAPRPAAGDASRPSAPIGRLLDAPNDPHCTVEESRIRFRDATVLQQAGIETAVAAPRALRAKLVVPAEVQFDATQVTEVTPRVGGVVHEARARLGDEVKVGDVLAIIESAALGEAKSRFIELRENHALAVADLERVREIHTGTQAMLATAQADTAPEAVLAELASIRVGEAKSRLLQAHAALQLARAVEAREKQLVEQKVSSQQELERARSGRAAAEAEFAALREEIAFSSSRALLEAERAVQVAKTALDAAERQLHVLGLNHDDMDKIDAEKEEEISQYALRSPAAGRIVARRITVGEAVEEGESLFTVADTSRMWLIMGISVADLPLLRAGLPVQFEGDGLSGRDFDGEIAWIAASVDEHTRTAQARVELPNPDGVLRAGMFGQAHITLRPDEPAVTVPEIAVQTDGCCQLVFVRESETVFVPRKIVRGTSAGGYVEILDGLKEGDVVATTGSYLMKTEVLKGNIGAGCCEVDPGR